MGIREFFGVKKCIVKAESCQNIEDLFLKIRDISFDAGKPEFIRNDDVIAFPALDEKNQIQIYGENGSFTVMRSTVPVGKKMDEKTLKKMVESFPESLGMLGNQKKLCMALCQRTADELNAMQL